MRVSPLYRAWAAVRAGVARVARAFGPRAPAVVVSPSRRPDRSRLAQLPPGSSSWERAYEEVLQIISAHERGDFRQSALLADALDRNPRIAGALSNRALGVTSSPFAMLAGLGDRRRAAAVARAAEVDWPMICPEQTVAEISRAMTTMGFAVAQIVTVAARGRWVPVLELWHAANLRWDEMRGVLVALTELGEVDVTPGDGRWVLFAHARQRPWMRGVVRCLGLASETRAYAVKDWRRWSEKHGLPLLELQVPASKAESDEAEEWFAQFRELASETTVVSPQGAKDQASYKANLIEARDTAWEGFKELIARQDGDVSIAIEGQNLATENTGKGTYASAKVGATVRQDLREADAYIIATALHEQVLRPWAQWNFGDAELAPWAIYDPTPPEDLTARATMQKTAGDAVQLWDTLAGARGLEVDLGTLAELYGMPLRRKVLGAPPDGERESAPVSVDDDEAAENVRAHRRSAERFLARHRHRHDCYRSAA